MTEGYWYLSTAEYLNSGNDRIDNTSTSVTGTIGKGRIQLNDKMILVVGGVSVQMVTVKGIKNVTSQEEPWYIEYPVGDNIVLTLEDFYDSVLENYTSAKLFSLNTMNT